MTKKAETGSPRVPLAAALGIAALLFAGWRVLTLGLADHFAGQDPAAALTWRDSHPAALLELAGREATPAKEREGLARRALRADPLNGRGYRLLGETAAARGDSAGALQMYTYAAARSPRDARAQAWLVDHHLRRGEVEAALAHLDPLLRVKPALFEAVMPVFTDLAMSRPAHAALAERLQTQPPWRSGVVRTLAGNAPDVDAIAGLFERLRTAPGGLPTAELEAWLDRLSRERRWGQAYLIWVSQLPPDRLATLGNVSNGGFEFVPAQGGFGWRFQRVAGARIDRVAGAGGKGEYALRVAFEDRRVPFGHVRQLLVLPPGTYTLSGMVRSENLRTERGLVWSVSCADGAKQGLVDSPAFRGHGGWRDFSVDFAVPEDCGGQWLVLRLPARIPAEQRIGGQVWFDEIRVRRRPATD